MIVALSIRSFVLIDSLDLEAATGFTALTGETGAGKSIILDALGLVLGAPANRKQVRAGCETASVAAEFALDATHAVWTLLAEQGLAASADETLSLRRTVSRNGPSRAFVNDQPVNAALLARIGEELVEIHGQHAASRLMRPSLHLDMLDEFGGHHELVEQCEQSWETYVEARTRRESLENQVAAAAREQDWLTFAVEELEKLAPQSGEAEQLLAQRTALMQSERIAETLQDLSDAMADEEIDEKLSRAARAAERLLRIPGLCDLGPGLGARAKAVADAIERCLIEYAEAQSLLGDLANGAEEQPGRLEQVESRLFALRGAGRKYECEPDELAERLAQFHEELSLCEQGEQNLDAERRAEQQAEGRWRKVAEQLSAARQSAATTLEAEIEQELKPLHLERVRVRVAFRPLESTESGARGLERAEFEVETNPGAGFGPLKVIASGGELARFSLALKCALSERAGSDALIFDEADQGVGGAVAAAIGERLARLAQARQVFAITHSPQVASSAARQWRVMKAPDAEGQLQTHVAQLDDGQRLEEIARMLSGSSITDEARAAASKLLEAA